MSTQAPKWGSLPLEMRCLAQWVVAGADKAPMYFNTAKGELRYAKVTDPKTWMSFEDACNLAWGNRELVTHAVNKKTGEVERTMTGLDIGFILSANDPYTCVDLDVKDSTNEVNPEKWTTPQQYDLFWRITQTLNSYTETSRSGKGLHIWVRAAVGLGVRRDSVEIYSQERFIICTGNVVVAEGIGERQQLIDNMVSQMRGVAVGDMVELVEEDSAIEDATLVNMAATAVNGEKFNHLCAGDYQRYGFPSQSEADLALMSMFAFYTKSNEQCRRLFRMSALGKREKAVRDDRYLNHTLKIIRSRQARDELVEMDAEAQARALVERLNEQYENRVATPMHVPAKAEPVQFPVSASIAATLAGPVDASVVNATGSIEWPPGLVGRIAGYIYQSAYKPVKEIAIVAALGFIAGIAGRAWTIPQSGLNIYLVLVARSAIGKEALHSGIASLCAAAAEQGASELADFVNFTEFASGPALIKATMEQPSMVNVSGEFGRKLKTMAHDDGRNQAMTSLRTVMTNLYQKSGPQSIVGGIGYSKKEDNVDSVTGVAYSMIGETTPGTFYESLTDSMMEDGFLSRFTVVEYTGDRPDTNPAPLTKPPAPLIQSIVELSKQAKAQIGINNSIAVAASGEAAKLFGAFEVECDEEIRSTTDEGWRQMWNRASLKAMRIAGLLAVGDHNGSPVIKLEHAEWAIALIRSDIEIMKRRIEDGDVGMGDNSREKKVLSFCRAYLKKGASEGYGIPKEMQAQGIIPRKFLQVRTNRVVSFSQHRMGTTAALDLTLRSLVDSGYLMELDRSLLVEKFGFHGKAFRILNIPK